MTPIPPGLETLDFRFAGTRAVPSFAPVLVGVVGSGNLEVMLEPGDGGDCSVRVQTSARGFAPIWRAVPFFTQMAQEAGEFDFAAVATAISDKMVRRHPYVFAGAARSDHSDPETGWEAIKAQERAAKGRPVETHGVLDDVPPSLPALIRAVKLTKRAARVSFDWPSANEVQAKLREEVAVLEVEIEAGDRVKAREELGDILFVIANLARKLDVEPEDALRGTNAKFVRRFRHIEARLAKDGRTPEQSDLAEMDALWDEAKALERQAK